MAPLTDECAEADAEQFEHRSSAARRVGTVVAGTYRITRHIGSGGSSHVFAAEHVRLGKHFAVKLLRPELDPNRRTAQRFRREARAIARLNSEHIVSVIDCGELDEGTPYLVMELLEGEDLRSLLNREGSLPARRAVPLIIEACRGLSDVHAAGLVHRDLKPENLFITRRSTGEDCCKVLDFGVAKMESSMSTAESAIVGTVRYMAPEQLADSAAVGPATDVYALGAILYECVAGRAVVSGSTVHEVMYRTMNAQPRALCELVPMLPPALVEVIERCLCKSPAARLPSAKELETLLQTAIAGASRGPAADVTTVEDAGLSPPAPPRRRPRPWMAVGALATALGAASAGWRAREASFAHESAPRASSLSSGAGPLRSVTPPPAGTPLASGAQLEAPRPASPAPSISKVMPTSSSLKPTKLGPRRVASVTSQTGPMNGFDSANPYSE